MINAITEKLAQPIQIKTSRLQPTLAVILAVFFVPMKIVNFGEIYQIVLALPCEHIEKTHYGTALD